MMIMKMNKKIKVILAAVVIGAATAGSLAFAVEEYVSAIYKEIDAVFVSKSESGLNDILQKNQNDRFYYLIENYTEKKIRRLMVTNDYDFALTATEVVIENNLDNERAVEMYASISDAYAVQKQYEEQQEIKRQKELARVEKEKESKRAGVEKQYVSSKTADGGAVYVSGKEAKSSSSSWKATLSLASLSLLNEQDSGVTALNYGIGAGVTYEYTYDKLTFGGDFSLDFRFIDLGSGDSKIPLFLDIDVLPKIGFPEFFRNFYVRAGFTALLNGKTKDSVKTANVVDDFYSPTIGIQFENIPLGSTALTFNYDYYLGHLFYEDITSAMGAGLNLAIPFTKIDQVKLTLNVGLKDRIFLKEDGLENRANIILAIGAENVNK